MADLSPAAAASQARAVAAEWIAAAPNLLEVLDWHRGLCEGCGAGGGCAERREIIDEYGAGEFGAAVFYPDGVRM